ncbi:PH domain-containing protein [Proteiniclasticum sp.]|uniref:PH domain-containing protein n=1 Tax=Proteiniclasticum sp. TaxID=2053595 RepID=UPI00289AA1A2|nr:PH domain-containing protein [Proteiniclasticum sp.]
MIIILQVSDNVLTKSLMMLLIISLLIVGASFLIFMKTLYYKVGEGIVTIGSIFRFTDIHIKIENIVYFTERITLLDQSGIAGMLSKRFSVGKGYIEGLGKVDMYITSSKKTIFFGTEKGNYGISPADMAGFSALLKKNGVKEEFIIRDVLDKDIRESADKLKHFFLLNAVMVLILVEIPIVLLYLGRLPEYVSISQLDTSMLSYVPAKVYVDSTVAYGIMAFMIALLAFVLAKFYSKIDKIYYYRVMLIPLVISVLLLLNLANILIPILL